MIVYRHPTAAEREAALDLVADAFPNEQARLPAVRAAVLADPDYAAERCLVAVDDGGRVLAHAAAKEAEVTIGARRLPAARLGAVCTARGARRQGLGRRLVEAACELVDHRAAVLLNPAREAYVRTFYESLGFVAAVRTQRVCSLAPANLPPRDLAVTVRAARLDDVPELERLYRRHYGPQPGSLGRSAAWWCRRVAGEPLLWSELTPAVRVAERDDRPVAYTVTVTADDLSVWEWAAEPGAEAEAAALLSAAAQGATRLGIQVAPHDPLAPWLDRCGGRAEPVTPRRVMVRAADVDSLGDLLAAVVGDHGGMLSGDDDGAEVIADGARLAADWSHLLALAYDGRLLGEWVADGTVRLTPQSARAQVAMAAVLPPRVAGRRATDAY